MFAVGDSDNEQTSPGPSAFQEACCGPLVATLKDVVGGWTNIELPLHLSA
eukprot:SAG31_NODE_1042_length_10187_cov_54.452121_8_plen_50_part_00